MKKALFTSLLAVAVCAAPALADDFVGSVELGGNIADVKNNKTKFTEYRDIGSGVTGNFLLDWANDKGSYFLFSGENIGYNSDDNKVLRDKEFFLKAGKQEEFKVSVFYKEIPHNLTIGARSAYTGIGTTALMSTLATGSNYTVANIAEFYNKPTFDYTIDRKNYGAELDFSFKSPFFVNARYERNITNGLLPMGTSNNGVKELPAPISYTTDNVYLTTGYRSNRLIFTLDGSISDFNNSNTSFTYGFNAAPGARDRTYLAPSSTSYKVGGNLMYRLPFWNTTFMARASHSLSENTLSLSEEATFRSINSFAGKITYTTASAAITTSPIKSLDVKMYLNLLDKKNDSSTGFEYHAVSSAYNAASIQAFATTETFGYNKLNGGFDLGYKLPAKTKLSAGYEYLRINRSSRQPDLTNTNVWGVRNDAPQTTDHILYLQAKNNLLDWLSAKVKYERLFRTSDFQGGVFNSITDNRLIKAFWRPADTADKTRDTVSLGLDVEPVDALSIGVEYSYKNNDYTKSVLGMQRDTRHEMYLDANYRIAMVKLNPFFDLELVESFSKNRRYSGAGDADPVTGQNDADSHNWTSTRKDVNYAFGLNADVDIVKDKLVFTSGYRYDKATGTQEFTTTFSPTTPLINNDSVDNYTKQSITAKLKYNLTKNLTVGLGYLFENLKYTDDHYTGYSYLTTATTASGTQLTGAYANTGYDAHVGYMTVGYKF